MTETVKISDTPSRNPTAVPRPLAIYVHWPFCLAKCPYCDFNSHVRGAIDGDRWRRALLRELSHFATFTPGHAATSLFFGGGTPSLMAPGTVAQVIAAVGRHWPLDADFEVTLEANPTSVEAGRFRAYRAAGVNRLSLGVQSFDDPTLGFLGREHDARTARAALELAHATFPRVSFDLIYAVPGQTGAAWRRELATALGLAGDHLSLYQLTIEPATGFAGAVRRGAWVPLDDDRAAALYDQTQAQCATAGLAAYEISNHARPGAACRHNLTYWRYGDYVGVGPGAHGRFVAAGERRATRQRTKPEAWLAAVEAQGHGTAEQTPIEPRTAAEEALLMGLRLTEGVDPRRIEALAGRPLD